MHASRKSILRDHVSLALVFIFGVGEESLDPVPDEDESTVQVFPQHKLPVSAISKLMPQNETKHVLPRG